MAARWAKDVGLVPKNCSVDDPQAGGVGEAEEPGFRFFFFLNMCLFFLGGGGAKTCLFLVVWSVVAVGFVWFWSKTSVCFFLFGFIRLAFQQVGSSKLLL